MDQTFVRMKKYYLTRQEQASLLTKRQNNSPEDYVECCSIIFKIGIIGEGEEREKGGRGDAKKHNWDTDPTSSSEKNATSRNTILFLATCQLIVLGFVFENSTRGHSRIDQSDCWCQHSNTGPRKPGRLFSEHSSQHKQSGHWVHTHTQLPELKDLVSIVTVYHYCRVDKLINQ